jgi:dTDP-4-amino-4,6-dideoxygalactose transaminase
MRQEHANYITNRISKHKEIKPPFSNNEYENIFQMYTITLNNKTTRDNLHRFLLEKKIFCKIYFSPIHLTKFYQNKIGNNYSLPNTEDISNLVLTLPLFPNMTQEEKEYLINSIDEFFEK